MQRECIMSKEDKKELTQKDVNKITSIVGNITLMDRFAIMWLGMRFLLPMLMKLNDEEKKK